MKSYRSEVLQDSCMRATPRLEAKQLVLELIRRRSFVWWCFSLKNLVSANQEDVQ